MPVRQDLVVTNKRSVVKLDFNNESGTYVLGVTGSLFDPIGGLTGAQFVSGITSNTAAISKIIWSSSSSTVGYNLIWDGATGATMAFRVYGSDGELNFEKFTLNNNAITPTGKLNVIPSSAVTGTLILEFVHASGSVVPTNYFAVPR